MVHNYLNIIILNSAIETCYTLANNFGFLFYDGFIIVSLLYYVYDDLNYNVLFNEGNKSIIYLRNGQR